MSGSLRSIQHLFFHNFPMCFGCAVVVKAWLPYYNLIRLKIVSRQLYLGKLAQAGLTGMENSNKRSDHNEILNERSI